MSYQLVIDNDTLSLCSTVVRESDSCVESLFYRGLCLFYLDHTDKAISHFQHVLRQHPDDTATQQAFKRVKSLVRLKEEGNSFIHQRRFSKAFDTYSEALRVDPLHDSINSKLLCNRALAAFNVCNSSCFV